MARPRPQAAPVIPTTSLVASAVRYNGEAARIYRPTQDWQTEAYRHFGICGEARFAATFFGHSLSKARLYAADYTGDKLAELGSNTTQAKTLAELFNGAEGQAQMLNAIGMHLTIAGECFLVGRTVGTDEDLPVTSDGEVWEIVSVQEMKVTGKKWSIHYGDGTRPVELTDNDVVIRIWRPHPAKRIEADSPFRSLLPILSEIEWLTRHIFAQTSSRLAGAGILMMPQEMTFPPPPEVDGKPQVTANDADALMRSLADAMLTPLEDPSSPASMVPIVITAPGEHIDKARLMHFWSDLDAASLEMRSAAIQRFALGMDLPPEQVLGMSSNGGTGGGRSNGVSHWGAWQIEEATIKLHVEPMLELVCNAITVGYLRPLTGDSTQVRADTSNLRLRPDRSREAFELYDRGQISATALLRETGFEPTDAMGPDEYKGWLLRKIAGGSATPEQVAAALTLLGVDLGPTQGDVPRETRPEPTLEDHPERPRTPDEAMRARVLLAACEPLILRGLERAGNRIRNAGARPECAAYETHCFVKAKDPDYLLDDAWSCAPQVLDGIADPDRVVPILDRYARSLLSTQQPHTRENLGRWLKGGVSA